MQRRRLLWHLYISILIVTITAIVATTFYSANSLKKFFQNELIIELEARAMLLENNVDDLLIQRRYTELDTYCKELGAKTTTRITVILVNGDVVADSAEQPLRMDNHAGRAEVHLAMQGQTGHSIRYSNTLQERMLYMAFPLFNHYDATPLLLGVLRLSIPITKVDGVLLDVYRKIAFGCLAIVIVAALLAWKLSRQVSKPLEEMQAKAERYGQGDFGNSFLDKQYNGIKFHEIAALDTTLDRMAVELDKKIKTVVLQHQKLETVFASMVEAVVVIAGDGRIESCNHAALKMFNCPPEEDVTGKKVLEVVRNADLKQFIEAVGSASEKDQAETEIVLYEQERFLQVHGAVLQETKDNSESVLIVLNDITRLKKLENMRRDFVANVSHELKTPITTIKGFVETLRDGALQDKENADRFIDIILKNTERLNTIIEDLLTLSRIEAEGERKEIELTWQPLRAVMAGALEICGSRAVKESKVLELTCADDLYANLNAPLMEQALVNLMVNAIKYSERGQKIEIIGKVSNDTVLITVKDFGVGIEAIHLPRLFERFYRSDKARSRKLGGTGLGLAIVKHIVQAHDATVQVESQPGYGTTFTIVLPGGPS